MHHFKTVIFATFLSYLFVFGLSPGAQLAQVVLNLFANVTKTSDVCIIHDTPNHIWTDLLDDFVPKLSGSFAVSRVYWSGYTQRKCDFCLILLESAWNAGHYNILVHKFLEAPFWNRYGKFVFVVVEEERNSLSFMKRYIELTASLGISNSALVFVMKKGDIMFMIQYNFFKRQDKFFDSIENLGQILVHDPFRNVFGVRFNVLLFRNEPFLFITQKRQAFGPHLRTVQTFAKQVNATLNLKIPQRNYTSSPTEVTKHLIDGKVSIVNAINNNAKYSDLELSFSQSGLCLLIPEKVVGSLLYHLLRPFSMELFIFIFISLLLLYLVGCIFPQLFPRGLFNQLFYGSFISEYKMFRIERITLLTLNVILFLLCESYLAKLFQFFFNQQYEPHIKSIEDLLSVVNHEIDQIFVKI